jgi:hypothetical protein
MEGAKQDRLSLRAADIAVLALFGALGGVINASLCYLQIPEAAAGEKFTWQVIPAGFLHGAVLAAIPACLASRLQSKSSAVRLLVAPVLGWLTGYLSWIPIERWVIDHSWSQSIFWVLNSSNPMDALTNPFAFFGLVAGILYLLLAFGGLRKRNSSAPIAMAVCAGVLGSLWFWWGFRPMYFALIHGTIWGTLVGLGVQQALKPKAHQNS